MMVMGRNPGNPLSLIKESWSGVNPLTQPVGKTVSEYLTELQTNLKEIHDVAATHASQEQQKYVEHYNKRTEEKHFELGQQVVVLLPDSTNTWMSRWQGPEL